MNVNRMLFLRCTEKDKMQQTEAAARETSVTRKKILHKTLKHIDEREYSLRTWRSSELQKKLKKKLSLHLSGKWSYVIMISKDFFLTPKIDVCEICDLLRGFFCLFVCFKFCTIRAIQLLHFHLL